MYIRFQIIFGRDQKVRCNSDALPCVTPDSRHPPPIIMSHRGSNGQRVFKKLRASGIGTEMAYQLESSSKRFGVLRSLKASLINPTQRRHKMAVDDCTTVFVYLFLRSAAAAAAADSGLS